MTACKHCGTDTSARPCVKARVCAGCLAAYPREYGRRYRASKPQAVRAHWAVANAILAGKLPALNKDSKCVDCGKRATQYDHRDYSKPLEVEPVCASCNRLRGPGLNAA